MSSYGVNKFGGLTYYEQSMINCTRKYEDFDHEIDVVSAPEDSTNVLLHIYNLIVDKKINADLKLSQINNYLKYLHTMYLEKINQSFSGMMKDLVTEEVGSLYSKLVAKVHESYKDKDILYASILQFGELIGSTIYHHFLTSKGRENQLLDAREFVFMDKNRDGEIIIIKPSFITAVKEAKLTVTQGFIGNESVGKFDSSDDSSSAFASLFFSPENIVHLKFWKEYPGFATKVPSKEILNEILEFFPSMTIDEVLNFSQKLGASPVKPSAIERLKPRISLNPKNRVQILSYLNPELPGTEITYN